MRIRFTAAFATLLAATVLLGGCGGGSEFGFVSACDFVGCRRSGSLASSEIAPDYALSSSGGAVLVTAAFRSPGSIAANVQLQAERLTVETEGPSSQALAGDAAGLFWSTSLPAVSADRSYQLLLVRADGDTLRSAVSLPAAFALLSPSASLALNRNSAAFPIIVSTAPTEVLDSSTYVTCGSARTFVGGFPFNAPTAAAGGSSYLLQPAVLQVLIDTVATGSTRQCTVELNLGRSTQGTLAAGFRSGGSFVARYEQDVQIVFDRI